MSPDIGRNKPCPCGSGKKYKRCCLDSKRTADSSASAADEHAHLPAVELTLIVPTPDEMMARHILSASTLPPGLDQGYAAEVATHEAAAVWGLPDFIYRPTLHPVGSGVREIGDGILIVGELGIVLQVKSRAHPTTDPEKERRWVAKQTRKALAQGAGTIRMLKQGPVEMASLRGRRVTINAEQRTWVIAVIIDNPNPPDACAPAVEEAKHLSLVLLRRDWEFLFEQLKSTHAVARYCERVAGETTELGGEPARYYELARADEKKTPELLAPGLVIPDHAIVSAPVLPLEPAGSNDLDAHRFVRTIFEDFALTRLTSTTEEERLRVLAELDRLPVALRSEMGRSLLNAMAAIRRDPPSDTVWRLKTLRGNAGQGHLGLGACSRPFTPELQRAFTAWVQLRHHDVVSVTGDIDGLTTVGVLLTPRDSRTRPWDTSVTAVAGELRFTEEELAILREVWPTQPENELAA